MRVDVLYTRDETYSNVISTSSGVYIVLLRQKKAGSSDKAVELKQVAISLAPDASAAEVASATTKLMRLRRRLDGCAGMDEIAGKAPGVLEADLGETAVSQLRSTFRETVEKLKVGEVSLPVRTDVGLHLIAVCGRHAVGVEGVTRADVTDRLRGEQLSMFARRYLRDLRSSAEIETR